MLFCLYTYIHLQLVAKEVVINNIDEKEEA